MMPEFLPLADVLTDALQQIGVFLALPDDLRIRGEQSAKFGMAAIFQLVDIVVDDEPFGSLIFEYQQCLTQHMQVGLRLALLVGHHDFAATFTRLDNTGDPAPGLNAIGSDAVTFTH